jgi:hypothetical protein
MAELAQREGAASPHSTDSDQNPITVKLPARARLLNSASGSKILRLCFCAFCSLEGAGSWQWERADVMGRPTVPQAAQGWPLICLILTLTPTPKPDDRTAVQILELVDHRYLDLERPT